MATASWSSFKDIHWRSQTLRHLYPDMGAQIGGIQGFSSIKITVIHQVHMICSLSMKINKTLVKCRTACEDRWRVLCVFVSVCVVGKKTNNPNCSSIADDAITGSGIGVQGSPFYIFEFLLGYFESTATEATLHVGVVEYPQSTLKGTLRVLYFAVATAVLPIWDLHSWPGGIWMSMYFQTLCMLLKLKIEPKKFNNDVNHFVQKWTVYTSY